MSRLKDLREKRAKVHADAVEILKNATATAEERGKAKAMIADVDVMTEEINLIIRAEEQEREIAGEVRTTPVAGTPVPEKTNEQRGKDYRDAFRSYLRWGMPGNRYQRGAKEDEVRLLASTRDRMNTLSMEQRDQEAGTQSITYTQGISGGFFVPAGFVYDVEVATKYFAPLLDGNCIDVFDTATGQVLPYPTNNDTNEAWTVLPEAAQVNDSATPNYPGGSAPSANPGNVTLGQINFGAWKGTTGLIRVSLELLQDSAFNFEAFLTSKFAERLGRGYEWYLTNGTGVSQPKGILASISASGAVPVVAKGSSATDGTSNTGTNSIGYQDLVNLQHSVDPTYRRGAKYMFHDQTLAFLKNLVDKFGRPLWVPSVRDGEPDRVCGYEYVINQAFPQIAPSANTVAFGAFKKFKARRVKDLSVLRLEERFADFGQIAYVAFSRIDSQLVDAGTHPLNVLQQHS